MGNPVSRKYPSTTFLFITPVVGPVVKGAVTRLSSPFVYNNQCQQRLFFVMELETIYYKQQKLLLC